MKSSRTSRGSLVSLGIFLCAIAAIIARGQGTQERHGDDASSQPWASAEGKVVVLIFSRTDCPIANRYAPEIEKLQAAHAADALFWMVYPDKRETDEAIRAHDAEYHLTLPVLRDPERKLVKRAQVSVTPEAAVFDAKGQLVYHGRIDNWFEDLGRARLMPTTHELSDAIAAAVSGHKVQPASRPAVGCYLSDAQ
jgi:hypothetical protein